MAEQNEHVTTAAPARPPAVTVVVPVYNMATYLERTIRSAAAQTYPHLRILAIDDGSTDRSPELLARLAGEIDTLRVVTVSNGGVARARNHGTDLAETDYVAYLDADDLWHPTKIEKQVAALERHRGDPDWVAAYTLFRRIDEHDRVVNNGQVHDARGSFFASHLIANHVGNGSSLLVRRDAVRALGGFDPSYAARGIGGCEDRDLQLRILQRHKMELVREYLVGYRKHGAAMSAQHSTMARSFITVTETFAGDPRVGPELRNAAFSGAHRYAWHRLARGGDLRAGLKSYGIFLRTEPSTALDDLMERGKGAFRHGVDRLAGRKCDREEDRSVAPHFYDLDPLDGIAEAERHPEARRLERLARFDRAFAEGAPVD